MCVKHLYPNFLLPFWSYNTIMLLTLAVSNNSAGVCLLLCHCHCLCPISLCSMWCLLTAMSVPLPVSNITVLYVVFAYCYVTATACVQYHCALCGVCLLPCHCHCLCPISLCYMWCLLTAMSLQLPVSNITVLYVVFAYCHVTVTACVQYHCALCGVCLLLYHCYNTPISVQYSCWCLLTAMSLSLPNIPALLRIAMHTVTAIVQYPCSPDGVCLLSCHCHCLFPISMLPLWCYLPTIPLTQPIRFH